MLEFLRKIAAKAVVTLGDIFASKRARGIAAIFVVIAIAGATVPHPAHAEDGLFGNIGSMMFMMLARIFQALGGLFGKGVLLVIGALVSVAQYSDFVSEASPVGTGWVLVRDVTNMFYILIMLLIAFGTMFGIEEYSYQKKTVTKLLLSAVFVNFSKLFCGLVIDFSQVIMLTFVYGFQAALGGNFLDAVGMNKWLEDNKSVDPNSLSSSAGVPYEVMLGFAMAMIMALITLVVVSYMTVMLVIRIVYIWLLVVMSPAAFFVRGVPLKSAEKYYGEWWGMFTSQLIFGPVMAFFLWLSLASVQTATSGFSGTDTSAGMTEAFTMFGVRKFVVAICLLVGGTQIASKISGATAGMAKTVMKRGSGYAVKGAKFAGKKAAKLAGKVSLPVGAVGADGRRASVQLGALTGAGITKLQGSGIYKTLGLDKDYNKLKAKEEQAKALAATGQTEKANSLRDEMYTEAGKKLPSDKAALRKYYEGAASGSIMKRAAAMKLANAGALEVSEVEEAAGNDLALKKSLFGALKKSGKMFAGLPPDAEEALQEMYADSTPGERAKFARQAIEGMMTAADGSPRDKNAAKALEVIDTEDFKNFPKELKQKLMNALQAGIERDPKNVALREKYSDLHEASEDDNGNKIDGDISKFKEYERSRLLKEQGLLVGAGATAKAFGEIDEKTGNFTDPASRAKLGSFLSNAKNRELFAKSVPSDVMLANGGNNDVMVELFRNLDSDGLASIVSDPSTPRDQAFAIMQAAKGVKNSSDPTAASQAAAIFSDYKNKDHVLYAAYGGRTYKAEARRFVNQAGGSVLRGAATAGITAAAVAMGPAGLILTPVAAAAGAKIGYETGQLLAGEHGEKGGVVAGLKANAQAIRERHPAGKTVNRIRRGVVRTGMKV